MRTVAVAVPDLEDHLDVLEWAALVLDDPDMRIVVPDDCRPAVHVDRLNSRPVVVRSVPASSRSVPELLELTERQHIDLLVVDRSPGTAHDAHFLGRLLRHTSVPVASLPSEVKRGRPCRVAVGVSGSHEPGPTESAATMASACHGQVVALHVLHPPLEFWARPDPRSRWAKTKDLFDSLWTEQLGSQGVACERVMIDEADVEAGLLRGAAATNCDVLVVGLRRLSDRGSRLGGVAIRVAQDSPIPVLAVPPQPRARPVRTRQATRARRPQRPRVARRWSRADPRAPQRSISPTAPAASRRPTPELRGLAGPGLATRAGLAPARELR